MSNSIICEETSPHVRTQVDPYKMGCCSVWVPRTAQIPSLFPPNYTSDQTMANKYPWWTAGQMDRTAFSAPLPQVYYPMPQYPRGAIEANCPTDPTPIVPDIFNMKLANWALTR